MMRSRNLAQESETKDQDQLKKYHLLRDLKQRDKRLRQFKILQENYLVGKWLRLQILSGRPEVDPIVQPKKHPLQEDYQKLPSRNKRSQLLQLLRNQIENLGILDLVSHSKSPLKSLFKKKEEGLNQEILLKN